MEISHLESDHARHVLSTMCQVTNKTQFRSWLKIASSKMKLTRDEAREPSRRPTAEDDGAVATREASPDADATDADATDADADGAASRTEAVDSTEGPSRRPSIGSEETGSEGS